MTDDSENPRLWRKIWSGLQTASDLVGKIDDLDRRLSKQEEAVHDLTIEQARIAAKLELSIRFIERTITSTAGTST